MNTVVKICAILSSLLCLLGGLWILSRTDFRKDDDALATAIGFYFAGKAFFVGPMLWLTGSKLRPASEG
jgi:hypothetical protein